MKKIVAIIFMSYLISYSYADTNIQFLNTNINSNQNLELKQINKLINSNSIIKEKILKNATNATIAPIYGINNLNHTKQINYYLLFVSSDINYSISTTQIFIANNEITKIVENYTPTKNDLMILSEKYLNYVPTCPNENINFVVGTPLYTEDPSKAIKLTIDSIYERATTNGYNVVKLLDQKATVDNYLNYLSCKNLKGFFNISHGSTEVIVLYNTLLTSELIKEHLKNKLSNTVIVFNSCNTFGTRGSNDLRYALLNIAKAQKFSGGISILNFATSEATSRCFWDRALNGAPLENGAMDVCASLYDIIDEWGIGGSGSNYLKLP